MLYSHALAPHHMIHNFRRIRQKLKAAPAMETGVADRLWVIGDSVKLVEQGQQPSPRGLFKYKKRVEASN